MFAEAASPFGRLVGFMFSPILRFASRPFAGRGEHSPEDVGRERGGVTGLGQGPPKDAETEIGTDPVEREG